MEEQVRAVIEQEVKPALQADGGDIQLIGVDDKGVVTVRLQGACAHCPGAQMTLKMGVERILKQKVSGVTRIVSV